MRVSESRVARRMRGSSARDAARESPPKMSTPRRWRKLREVEAQTRTCLPPYAHTNRVGNTICSYIACCAIGADPPSRGTSVPPTAVVVVVQRTQLRGVLKKVSSESAGLSLKTPACVEEIQPRRAARAKRCICCGEEGYTTVRRSSDRATSASPRDTERGRPRALTLETRSRLAGAVEEAKRGRERARGRGGSAGIGRGAPRCSSTSSWTRTSSWSRVTSGRTCRRC